MSTYHQYRDTANETTLTILHDDGRKTIYTRDSRGREFFSLFGRRGEFQGTHPLNRIHQAEKPSPKP